MSFSPIYTTLRQAITERRPVIFLYAGYHRECCPHSIGTKNGKEHVLVFQFAGGSSQGLPPGGQWRCMDVAAISQIAAMTGPWRTGTSHLRPQTCIDHVDVDTLTS